ncbi:MAG: hypothetical protein JW940_37920 [Polyangiaceae bacterium]|nr:hypothetical protein [Polyangiaceae bacterium]
MVGSRRSVLGFVIVALVASSALVCGKDKHRVPAQPQGGAGGTPAPSSSAASAPRCPTFEPGPVGTITAKALDEASGLAASRRNRGVFWSHNDSGGTPELFAMTESGSPLGTYLLEHAKLEDWEDIAIGPGPRSRKWYLYVGDIGANNAKREHLVVYRAEEPRVRLDQKDKRREIEGTVAFRLRYPDRRSRDSETLMVDPVTADLYLVTKSLLSNPELYVARAPLDEKKTNVLERVMELKLEDSMGLTGGLVTAGDIAADGSAVLIRTYMDARYWPRASGRSVAEALQNVPCTVPLHREPQGEAIAFSADGRDYLTVSEGRRPRLYSFVRNP